MMQSNNDSFLSRVVTALLEKDESLHDMVVLLPSRKAIQQLKQEIVSRNDKPVFMPRLVVIDNWIEDSMRWAEQDVQLEKADELSLIHYLYLSYCDVFYARNKELKRESFEDFYFWGKIILSDFDDMDKHLADPALLFSNLSQYREIDEQFNPLSDEQKLLLEHFFASFKAQKETGLRANFANIWNCLEDIYTNFHDRLQKEGLAYAGMIYRKFYDKLQGGKITFGKTKFAVVGFNVLNQAEQKIFEYLQTKHGASFYWDYDQYYTEDKLQEAGSAIRDNIKKFPNKEFEKLDFNRISTKQQNIEIISSNGEILQTSHILKWVSDLEKAHKDNLKQEEMAIILANEGLLPMVIRSLPQNIMGKPTNVNISMGYPFSQTKLYAFIEQFIASQSRNAPPVTVLKQLLAKIEDDYGSLQQDEGNDLLIEAAYEVNKKIEKFIKALEKTDNNTISPVFLQKIFMSELRSLPLSFESKNAKGIQIMRLSESRNLDFRHILMLSASDDFLPSIDSFSTFIPHSIGKAFGLMSMEKRITTFAYYFYRLFHCAQSLTFVYNTQSDGTKAKEMSRFLQQAQLEMKKPQPETTKNFQYNTLLIEATLETSQPKDYLRKPEHIKIISNKKYLSAAFINTFLDCELRLYFKYIIRLDSVIYGEDDVSALAFGNLFHQSANILYQNKEEMTPEQLLKVVNQALDHMESAEERSVITQIHKDIVIKYLQVLIQYNKQTNRQPLIMEEEVEKTIIIGVNGSKKTLKLGGRIDRIDFDNGDLVVVDYKTGGEIQKFVDLDTLFHNSEDKRAAYIFQILFYCWLLWDNPTWKQRHNLSFASIKPQIIYIHKLKARGDKDFSPLQNGIPVIYDAVFHEEFDRWLKDYLTTLFSLDQERFYGRNKSDKNCEYCEYSTICS